MTAASPQTISVRRKAAAPEAAGDEEPRVAQRRKIPGQVLAEMAPVEADAEAVVPLAALGDAAVQILDGQFDARPAPQGRQAAVEQAFVEAAVGEPHVFEIAGHDRRLAQDRNIMTMTYMSGRVSSIAAAPRANEIAFSLASRSISLRCSSVSIRPSLRLR
jgi:hypothetical protein